MTERKKRTTPKYLLFRAGAASGTMEIVKEAPKPTQKAELEIWLKKNAEKLLADYAVESIEFAIFREPEKKTVSRKTVVEVK